MPVAKETDTSLVRFHQDTAPWILGTRRDRAPTHPALFRKQGDGEPAWRAVPIPDAIVGEPTDLFFLDANHGWLAVFDGYVPVGGSDADLRSTLLRTQDGGRSWTEDVAWQHVASLHESIHAVRFLSTGFGVLAVGRSVLTTADGGSTWSKTGRARHDIQSCEIIERAIWCVSGMTILKISP